ncbi:hypothetical protein ACNRBH_09150 [Ralstonia pseudosolanacearum]|uniref:hypothetical protein n=1 Tax=Ralstonia pseudosolanacearum TaxID=1310165 RepID=UPI0026745CF4|nr:hypothetical protein [Ralstonia pseudosolanacearum]MDO3527527.1 hypothetical protein [Ralstonia pseudosolanacearum]MDO3531606.1 hypothetical protein [Ralstonia pseudosolanacearum]
MSEADDYLAHAWRITDHVCATCFGRVLARPGSTDESEVYRCSNCGVERAGESEAVICACSLPGVRCEVNDDVSPLWPGEIVAMELAA